MSATSNIFKVDSFDTPSATLAIAGSSTTTTVNLGANSKRLLITRLQCQTMKQNVYYFNTQTFSPTVADFLANGTLIISLFNTIPAINDVITVNLPVPTQALEGCYFMFRKMKGQISNGSVNWTFITSPASILPGGGTLTSSASVVITTSSFNPGIQRIFVIGNGSGSYYWTFA